MQYIGYSYNSFVKMLDLVSINVTVTDMAWFSISFISAVTSLHLSYTFPPGN